MESDLIIIDIVCGKLLSLQYGLNMWSKQSNWNIKYLCFSYLPYLNFYVMEPGFTIAHGSGLQPYPLKVYFPSLHDQR
jgi:hypothetical protein